MPDPSVEGSLLFTDLYSLTMAQAYFDEGMKAPATFELYFRKLPGTRNFTITAGLEDVLAHLESLRIRMDELDYLRGQGEFHEAFLEHLSRLRFTGDVHAVPEGTVLFENEPSVQVVAPIVEAQLLEAYVINQVHVQTLAASKAARVVLAAAGRPVLDFGSRRTHGSDAALKVARGSYIAGAAGTSNVLAGKLYGIPIAGTMAHSYVLAHDEESQAFEAFARHYPGTTMLVDTYDTIEGVRRVIELRRRLGESFRIGGIRLDSGDMAALAIESRRLLDGAGMNEVRIIASGGLDEHRVAEMLRRGAPIDAFGVGTRMVTSEDAPSLDLAYKLVEYDGRPRMKLSPHKLSYPYRKQVFRQLDAPGDDGEIREGEFREDIVAVQDEDLPGERLLRPVMLRGERCDPERQSLAAARERAARELDRLPEALKGLEKVSVPYPVRMSPELEARTERLRRSLAAKGPGG